MNLQKKTDEDLVTRILETDCTNRRACQEELYERYINKVYGKCLLICKEPEAAKDISQDVFIIVFTKLNSFRNDSPFYGWLFKIAHYECLAYLRKKNRLNLSDDAVENIADNPKDEKVEAFQQDQLAGLNYAFEQLTDINRTVMILKYKEGKAIKEIAEMLEVGESAVKMRIKRSKLFIQNILTSQKS